MSKFWSPGVSELTPYTPGEQPRERLIKLNTNENPYPPAPGVEARAARVTPIDHLRFYPDPDSRALREALAKEHGVEVEQVFVGNGSDEVLASGLPGLLPPAAAVVDAGHQLQLLSGVLPAVWRRLPHRGPG